jgi:serine phosphatase RsbU (regulator of sigma subunit)
VGRVADHHEVLGVTGATAVLIAVGAAALAGPVSGVLASGVGAAAFFVFVTDLGLTAPLPATLASAAVWALLAMAVGMVATRMRQAEAQRRAAEEDAARLHTRLETRLVPRIDGSRAGLEVHSRYRPGEQRLAVGGDFFDVATRPDGTAAIVVGDVVGHGADAAALGATLRAGWRALIADGASPHTLVRALSRVLEEERDDPDTYVTVCAAWLRADGSQLELLSLGHAPPLVAASGNVEPAHVSPCMPLGWFEDFEVVTTKVTLPPQWTLFFYTDGVIEGRSAPGASERYGAERLRRRLERELFQRPAEEAIDRVLSDAEAANGGPLSDDATILSVSGKDACVTSCASAAAVDLTA